MKKLLKYGLWAIVIIAVSYFIYNRFIKAPEMEIIFQNEPITKASLFKEVSATGTINPIEIVDVGTQVSGTISKIYTDFNKTVKKGQVIATIDMRNLSAVYQESKANLSKANVVLAQAKREKDRAETLIKGGVIPVVEKEKAEDAYNSAIENVKVAELQVEKSKVNLGYATIVSPIDGIVISRNIDEGQTVAASFTTPTLFRIANDLSKMKIEASVDEADIGQVKKGQKVTFTVDTYADETFDGIVDEIQLQPIIAQNVVTYNVIVLIDNPDLKLLPGMTATLLIKTLEHHESLTIPNTALTFKFNAEQTQFLKKNKFEFLPLPQTTKNKVWIKNNKVLKQVEVTPTFDNGFRTAISTKIASDSVITNIKIEEVVENEESSLLMPNRNKEED